MPFSEEKILSYNSPANELASQSTQQPQPVCTWSAHAPQSGSSPSPFPRYGHTLTATAAGELFLFGGSVRGCKKSDLYVISTRDFSTTLLQTSGEVPTPRYTHRAALIGTTLLVCGGIPGNHVGVSVLDHNSLDLLNLETREWSRVAVNGPGPGLRYEHTTNVVGSKVFIFGGHYDGKTLSDMWALDFNCLKSKPIWESYGPTLRNEKPPRRSCHVSVTTGDHIIIFGGRDGRRFHNDTWSFDISTRKWTELQCTGSIPSPRANDAAVLVDGVMYVFGGVSGGTSLDDLIALQLSTKRWFKIRNVGPSPHNRSYYAMASDGTHVFVLGGLQEEDDIYVFDTKDIKYPEPERDVVNPNEKTIQLPQKSSTGPLTQGQPQHPTSSSSDAHGASHMKKARPFVSGHPATLEITHERNPGPNGRPLEHTVVRDPEDGVNQGEDTTLELERQLSISLSVQTEQGQRIARLADELAMKSALLEQAEANLSVSLSVQTEQGQRIARLADELAMKSALLEQAKANAAVEKRRAILELREHEDRLLAQTSLAMQGDAELVDTRSKLRNAEAKLDESLLSLSQQIVRYAAELANVRAELEVKKSELEAVRLRPTDADGGWARSKTKAGKLHTETAASRVDLNEDRDMCDPKEDKQVMEAGSASPQWNERSRDG